MVNSVFSASLFIAGCTFTVLVYTRESATRNMEKVQVIKVRTKFPFLGNLLLLNYATCYHCLLTLNEDSYNRTSSFQNLIINCNCKNNLVRLVLLGKDATSALRLEFEFCETAVANNL